MADGAPAQRPGPELHVIKPKAHLGLPGLIVVGAAAATLLSCVLPPWKGSGVLSLSS